MIIFLYSFKSPLSLAQISIYNTLSSSSDSREPSGCLTLNDMIELLTETQTDYDKFYVDGNKSAGTRVRKAMQQIKTAAHEVRVHVQSTKNG